MRRVRLGQTGLRVSVIGFGTSAFVGGRGTADIQQSKDTIHDALELGINLFDTAQEDGFGVAERLLGDALRERASREDVIIATKRGLRIDGDRLLRDASRRWLREGVESSLRKLGTDYIDLYQVHWPDPGIPAEETTAALEQLVAKGLVRHVGVSSYDVDQIQALGRSGWVETLQTPYDMFRRGIEGTILPYTAQSDIGVLASIETDNWRGNSTDFTGERFRRNLMVTERLKALARELDVSLPQLAAAWTLANPAVHVAIVCACRPTQLDGITPAAGIELAEADMREIDTILAGSSYVSG